jgi:Fe-S cluster assembly iron-binding protein IscA
VLLIAVATAALAAGADPVLGTWKLNPEKSTYKPGPAPKSQTRVYQATKEGTRVSVTTVNANGATTVFQFDSNADGKDYPVTGENDADAVSMRKVTDYISESTLKHGERVIAFVLREISEDGKTMKMTYSGYSTWKGYEERISNIAIYDKQ